MRAAGSASPVAFEVNRTSDADVLAHLIRCDAHFIPPLSERVDLGAYAQKIVRHAERFEAWAAGELVALVAAYTNDAGRRAAFVTSVSVVPERRGERIAKRLMEDCIDHVRRAGFERVSLKVNRGQRIAIRLYESCGFSGAAKAGAPNPGSDIIMTLEIKEAAAGHARL